MWPGCSLPRDDDFVDLGAVDLNELDVHGLLALARTIGIAPVAMDEKPYTEEVLRKAIVRHAMTA